MSLESLHIENVRVVAQADLEFDERCNLISGPNASGKTTLLESVFLLGRGRSFRSAKVESLIRSGTDSLRVVGTVRSAARRVVVGLEAGASGLHAKIGGQAVASLAELALTVPVQSLDPDVHRLIEGGPLERRRYVDWGVFHVERGYIEGWRRFQRALKQRNAALKRHARAEAVRAWDTDLVETAQTVSVERARYVNQLAPHVADVGRRLLGGEIGLDLRQGWDPEVGLREALERSWSRDRERGVTHVGPHRAELAIRFDGGAARGQVSRGQQKLLAAALLLGQLKCDAALGSQASFLLVDDPAAELDREHLQALLLEVRALRSQLFVTALDVDKALLEGLEPGRMFNVERGKVTALL
jgi:DNA replication and repair protein RecF